MRNRLLLKWPQCTLFNDFGTLCCNKIKKIYKIQIYKISSFLFFLKFYKKKNQITQEIYSLWSTTFHFMSSQIATCLTDQNNYSTAVDQILHALCFELEHLGPLPRAAAPAEKDTRTIRMLKECLAMWGWNMYISLYIFTGRNLITHLTLFFVFQIKFQIHLYNVYKVRAQDRQVCIWGQAPRCPGEVSSRCLHIPYFWNEEGNTKWRVWIRILCKLKLGAKNPVAVLSGCSSSTSIGLFFQR